MNERKTSRVAAATIALLSGGCDGLAAFASPEEEPGEPRAFELDLPVSGPLGSCDEVTELDYWVDSLQLDDGGCYFAPDGLFVAGELASAPGVRVGFSPGTSLEVGAEGTLALEGTTERPVLLTGLTGGAGDWVGVRIGESSEDNIIAGTTVQGAGSGDGGAAIEVGAGAEVLFDGATVRRSGGDGLVTDPDARVGGFDSLIFEQVAGKDHRVREVGEDPLVGEEGDAGPAAVCEVGDSQCAGSEVMACLVGQWQSVKDCAENIDSGRTLCALYDGQGICEEPPPAVCTRLDEQLRSGIPLPDIEAHDDTCLGASTCEEAGTRACMMVNMLGAPVVFEGEGEQWIDLVAYDSTASGIRNRISGVAFSLEGGEHYTVEVHVDQIVELDIFGRVFRRTDGDPSARDPLATGRTGTAVWPSVFIAPARQKSVRLHVMFTGDAESDGPVGCAPWVLTVDPNPCPSEEGVDVAGACP